jgi:hypothetical protein
VLIAESVSEFRNFILNRGLDPDGADLGSIVEATFAFYESVPAFDPPEPLDSDMLLFQFGVYDWGNGEHFEFDLTRQFIEDEKGEQAISQLGCRTIYDPAPALRSIGSAHQWCHSRSDLTAFKKSVLSGPAYLAALRLPAQRREITWSPI